MYVNGANPEMSREPEVMNYRMRQLFLAHFNLMLCQTQTVCTKIMSKLLRVLSFDNSIFKSISSSCVELFGAG